MASTSAIFAVVLFFYLVTFSSSDESVRFGYGGALGPNHWGSLSPQFAVCSKGKHQSPINIETKKAVLNPNLKPLERHYVTTRATLVDNQINIMVRYNNTNDTVMINGIKYCLKQLHWHSPSEHTINGERFAMELHMVHATEQGNLTVLAILYRYGKHDPFLDKIKSKIEELAKDVRVEGKQIQVPMGHVRMTALTRRVHKYFRYSGSLTTPPCTENIIWNILLKVRQMSKGQAEELRSILGKEFRHDARPTQPLNDRIVEMYDDSRMNKKIHKQS
ncbi:hypothetical protein LUZ60_004149 [Juncus effusus]|nr:hypothetical protein LUZ60_004149 [Juncus effusus]